MFSLCLIFCGVIASPSTFPTFWIFMYRVSPFTYLVSGMLSTGLAGNRVNCADNELIQLTPPEGETCQNYLSNHQATFGGEIAPDAANGDCRYCTYVSTDVFLAQINSSYANRWRDFGILWAFIIFNMFMAVFLYWLARVPKKSKEDKEKAKAEKAAQKSG